MQAEIESQPALLDGMVDRPGLQAQLPGNPSQRTIQRWEQQGLPVIRRGRLRLYDIAAVRAWLRGDRQPRKRRAA